MPPPTLAGQLGLSGEQSRSSIRGLGGLIPGSAGVYFDVSSQDPWPQVAPVAVTTRVNACPWWTGGSWSVCESTFAFHLSDAV